MNKQHQEANDNTQRDKHDYTEEKINEALEN
jgi:hypothetical protein